MSPAAARRIVYRPLTDLVEDPRNPKGHDLALIDSSVGRFGFVEPTVLDGRTGQLIAGHGRTETLRLMERRGDAPPEGVRKAKDGSWLVPVVEGWSSRTDAEAAAALIALNRTSEVGGWVDDALLELLDGLDGADDLLGVGYGEAEIEALRGELAVVERSAPEEFPEFGSDIATQYSCPSCGYSWSGASNAGASSDDGD